MYKKLEQLFNILDKYDKQLTIIYIILILIFILIQSIRYIIAK